MSFTDVGKSCPSREFLTSGAFRENNIFAKISEFTEYFRKRLADGCGDTNVVTTSLSVVGNDLVSSDHDEIAGHGRQSSSTRDWKEAKVLFASFENMNKLDKS